MAKYQVIRGVTYMGQNLYPGDVLEFSSEEEKSFEFQVVRYALTDYTLLDAVKQKIKKITKKK